MPSFCTYVFMIFCVCVICVMQMYVPNILLFGDHGWDDPFYGYELVGLKRLDYFFDWHVGVAGYRWFNNWHRIWVTLPIIAIFQKFFLQVEFHVRHEVNRATCLIVAVFHGEVGYIDSLKSERCKCFWKVWAIFLALVSCVIHVYVGFMLILFVGKSLTTVSLKESNEVMMVVVHVVSCKWVMEFAEQIINFLPLWRQWYDASYYKDHVSAKGCATEVRLSSVGTRMATKLTQMFLYASFRLMRNFGLVFIVFVYVCDAKTGEHRGV